MRLGRPQLNKTEKILIIAVLAVLFFFGIVVGIKLTGWDIITVNVSETFSVTLSENSASTGYEWQVTYISDPSVLKMEKTEYTVPEQVGGEGKVTLTFRALRTGNAMVVLQCTHPWEKNFFCLKNLRCECRRYLLDS